MSNIETTVKKAARKWEKAGIEKRLRVLQEAGQKLAENKKRVCEIFLLEGICDSLAQHYADWITYAGNPTLLERYASAMAQRFDTGSTTELLVRRADGVVLLFAQAGSPTFNAATLFSTLLPGNGVIVLRAPFIDYGVRFIVEEILHPSLVKHGFDKEVVQIITENYKQALPQLVAAKEVNTIISIGNNNDNNMLENLGRQHFKKVILEHYGRGCMVVWKDAPLDKAVDSACRAFDFCTKPCFIPKHFLVHEQVYEEFISRFLDRLPKYSNTIDADKINGVLTPVARLDKYLQVLEEAQEVGEIRYGGYRMDANSKADQTGLYAPPTVVALKAETCLGRYIQCVDEELYFPLVPIIQFSGEDMDVAEQMSSIIMRQPVGLRTSIWTYTKEIIEYFTKEISTVSMLRFNNDHSKVPLYASFWGGANGDNHLFWEKTSHLQAIDCQTLNEQEINLILNSLGALKIQTPTASVVTVEKSIAPTVEQPVKSVSEKPQQPISTAISVNEPPVHQEVKSNKLAQTLDELLATNFSGLNFTVNNGVARIELNRPKYHNSLDKEMLESFYQITNNLSNLQSQIRCLVITGKDKSFCSGANLKDLTSFTPEQAKEFMLKAGWSFRRLERLSVPVIAAVKGYCMGGGFEMSLHCDEIIAAESTVFNFPETGIGIITTTGAISRVIAAVGTVKARLLLTGQRITAKEALDIGLVGTVVPDDKLEEAVEKRCQQLVKQPAIALAELKRVIGQSLSDKGTVSWASELETFEKLSHGPWQEHVSQKLKGK
jgi:enoyl-CoA hydratase